MLRVGLCSWKRRWMGSTAELAGSMGRGDVCPIGENEAGWRGLQNLSCPTEWIHGKGGEVEVWFSRLWLV